MSHGQAQRPIESLDGSKLRITDNEGNVRDVDAREILLSMDASLKGILSVLRAMAVEQGVELPEEIEDNDA